MALAFSREKVQVAITLLNYDITDFCFMRYIHCVPCPRVMSTQGRYRGREWDEEKGNGVRVDKNRRMRFQDKRGVYVRAGDKAKKRKKAGEGKRPKAMTCRYRIWMMNMRRPIRPFMRFPETKGDE